MHYRGPKEGYELGGDSAQIEACLRRMKARQTSQEASTYVHLQHRHFPGRYAVPALRRFVPESGWLRLKIADLRQVQGGLHVPTGHYFRNRECVHQPLYYLRWRSAGQGVPPNEGCRVIHFEDDSRFEV